MEHTDNFKKQITNKYNSTFKITVTYEAETWKFNKNLESNLMSMEIDFLRRSARRSRLEKIRNNVIREKTNIDNSVFDYIRYKQLNWDGHMQRKDQEKLPKRI